MIKQSQPLASERLRIRKQRAFKDFIRKYPSPFYAWGERQRSQSVRRYWAAMMDPYLLPEVKVLLAPAHEPTESQDLWDCWYRAAVTALVHPIKGRVRGDFTELDLAGAFGIAPGRYRGLIMKERAWLKRSRLETLPIAIARLVAGQPDAEDLFVRLFK